MPAATSKADLHATCTKDYAKLRALIDPLKATEAGQKDADGWSIRDVIAHRAHWAGLFLTWQADSAAGLPVQTPAPGYKWNQLKAYNAVVLAQTATRDWAQVREDLDAAQTRLMAYIDRASDADLYTAHLYSWMNDWTLGRWAEAAGASHYRSAAKTIRKMLRAQS